MIGEIRDLETATIAINASLTGHLVFSHAAHERRAQRGDALDRHRREAVPGGLLHARSHGATARAQNLQEVRRTVKCRPKPNCGCWDRPRNNSRRRSLAKARAATIAIDTGFRGRFGIFEIFVIDDEVRKLIYEKVPSSVLRARAREMGMRTLREDGVRKVLAG